MKNKKIRSIISCFCISAMLFTGHCQIIRGEPETIQELMSVDTKSTEVATEETDKGHNEESLTDESPTEESDSASAIEADKIITEETKESIGHEDSISGNQPSNSEEEKPFNPSETEENIASDSDAGENIASNSNSEVNIASDSDAKMLKPADPVFHVTIPVELPFRIDLFEVNGRGQIYSDNYVFQNLGDEAVKVNISQMYCEFTKPEEYREVSTPSEINPESELKDLYLFLERLGNYGNESPGIVITDHPQESTDYSFVLPSGLDSEDNKITFRMTGEVNESSDYEWRSGEVKVVMVVSFEEVKSEEEIIIEEIISEEETLINDLEETSAYEPKETLKQDTTEEKSTEAAVGEDQKPPADKSTETSEAETTSEDVTQKEETTAKEETIIKEETTEKEEISTEEPGKQGEAAIKEAAVP